MRSSSPGSVFGLAAADGVVAVLSGRGLHLKAGAPAIPSFRPRSSTIWAMAVTSNGAGAALSPTRHESVAAARREFALGAVGAGLGAGAGIVQVAASVRLDRRGEGLTVGALVAVNPIRLGVHARWQDLLGLAFRDRWRVRWPAARIV